MRLSLARFLFLAALLSSSPLSAQVRTWVATFGVDNATCTRSSPCRNFAAAITAVADGGEVVVLDSGGFGQVTITKGVTLIAPKGIHAAIAPTAGIAIEVNTSANVGLFNLFLNSQGATQGITTADGPQLTIEDLLISGFPQEGIHHGADVLYLNSTLVRDCGSGLYMEDSSTATILNSRFVNNQLHGVHVSDGSHAVIRGSVASGNGSDGFLAEGNSTMVVESCVAAHNGGTGVHASLANVVLSNSTISFNVTGIENTLGDFRSRGNNAIFENFSGDEDGQFPYLSARSNALKIEYFPFQTLAASVANDTRAVAEFREQAGPGMDTVFEVVNLTGRGGTNAVGEATITLNLFDENGLGLSGSTSPVCITGCVFVVDMVTPKARIRLEDLIVSNGGGMPADMVTGFATINVSGPGATAVIINGIVETRD